MEQWLETAQVSSKVWLPWVRFQMPSELREEEYKRWLERTLRSFVKWLYTPETARPPEVNTADSNGREGAMPTLNVGKWYLPGCKLYLYQGSGVPGNVSDWKGLLFREHDYIESAVSPIYNLAYRFELFLRERGIAYERYGLTKDAKVEVAQPFGSEYS